MRDFPSVTFLVTNTPLRRLTRVSEGSPKAKGFCGILTAHERPRTAVLAS